MADIQKLEKELWEAADNLRFMADAGDIILLKGSNSMQVGKMLEMFK